MITRNSIHGLINVIYNFLGTNFLFSPIFWTEDLQIRYEKSDHAFCRRVETLAKNDETVTRLSEPFMLRSPGESVSVCVFRKQMVAESVVL